MLSRATICRKRGKGGQTKTVGLIRQFIVCVSALSWQILTSLSGSASSLLVSKYFQCRLKIGRSSIDTFIFSLTLNSQLQCHFILFASWIYSHILFSTSHPFLLSLIRLIRPPPYVNVVWQLESVNIYARFLSCLKLAESW